jgi:hypothetical protein
MRSLRIAEKRYLWTSTEYVMTDDRREEDIGRKTGNNRY